MEFGSNAFRGRFDWYEWSAPEYRGAEQILKVVRDIAGTGRRLSGVRVIGAALSMTRSAMEEYEHEQAARAGLNLSESGWKEWCLRLMIPHAVRLCEPVILDFEDGTALEFYPEASLCARIGRNAIPRRCVEGLNVPNFDADGLFGKYLRSRQLQDFFISEKKESSTRYRLSGKEVDTSFSSRTRRRYVFSFSGGVELVVSTSSSGWYELSLSRFMEKLQLPYVKFRAASRPVEQPLLCPGSSGEEPYFLIYGTAPGQNFSGRISETVSFSVDDQVLDLYLHPFLEKWYEPSLNERSDFEPKGFDCYNSNYYSKSAVQGILNDMHHETALLRAGEDSEFFRQHMEFLKESSWLPAWIPPGEATSAEKERARIISFFERFSARMEGLLRVVPDGHVIDFLGP